MWDPRILVVDNEPRLLDVIADVLREAGYSPRCTTDSREAAELLQTTAFDLILSEIVMPHLGGFQLLDLAKRQNPRVRVVLVTGYASREVAIEAVMRGVSGFVEKPFRTEELLAAVRRSLEGACFTREPTG